MSHDDWTAKLNKGEPLPLKLVLSEKVLEEIGIASDVAHSVLSALQQKGHKTWGNLLGLKSEQNAIEATGGDFWAGRRIWNFVQKENAKAAGTAAVDASKLNMG